VFLGVFGCFCLFYFVFSLSTIQRTEQKLTLHTAKPDTEPSSAERAHSRTNSGSETDSYAPDPFEAAFKPIFFGYLKDMDAKLRTWCEKACELDKGQPVSIGIKQSSSVIDV
jgi:hypothetical protein